MLAFRPWPAFQAADLLLPDLRQLRDALPRARLQLASAGLPRLVQIHRVAAAQSEKPNQSSQRRSRKTGNFKARKIFLADALKAFAM